MFYRVMVDVRDEALANELADVINDQLCGHFELENWHSTKGGLPPVLVVPCEGEVIS